MGNILFGGRAPSAGTGELAQCEALKQVALGGGGATARGGDGGPLRAGLKQHEPPISLRLTERVMGAAAPRCLPQPAAAARAGFRSCARIRGTCRGFQQSCTPQARAAASSRGRRKRPGPGRSRTVRAGPRAAEGLCARRARDVRPSRCCVGQPARVQTLCAVRAVGRPEPASSAERLHAASARRARGLRPGQRWLPRVKPAHRADRPDQASGPGAAHTRDVRAVRGSGCNRAAATAAAASSRLQQACSHASCGHAPRGRPRRRGWRSRSPPRRPAPSCAGRRRGGCGPRRGGAGARVTDQLEQ